MRILVPGFAGLRGGRPALGGLAILAASAGACLVALRDGPVPAPLALGVWPELVLPWLLVPIALAYAGLTLLSIQLREGA